MATVLVLATPAAAQARIDVAGGYQYLTFIGDYTAKLPAGWGVSLAAGKERVKFVVDVGGSYGERTYTWHSPYFANGTFTETIKDELYTFQGGVEFSGPPMRVVPFVRLLAGAEVLNKSAGFVFTPEAGMKIMITDHLGAQVTAGFPALANGDGSAGTFRFFAGVVYRK
jgi:hypothetical protein